MSCTSCGHTNRARALFCEECGARQPEHCATCQNPLSEGARFCDRCGRPRTRASDGEDQPAGEWRQLTVLFCDLVGSTALSQQVDAEDLSDIVVRYHRAATATVNRWEGYVAQYLGDGLLAYFGYPSAHEDDAERAVRAGLEILTALAAENEGLERDHGVRLAARIGIHTGPVVFGEVGSGSRRELLALGDTTNIAARLEGAAEPDSVLISDATLRLVRGIFVTRDRGLPPLKGVTTPVRAYSVLQAGGVRSRIDSSARLTPLAGRAGESERLLEEFERARRGAGRGVLVSGEAGVGKSRLVWALRERVGSEPHTWLEARCSPHNVASALHPVIDLVARGLRFEEEDGPAEKLTKLEAGLSLGGFEAADAVPLFAALYQIPLDTRYPTLPVAPERVRQRTLAALVDWALALAALQPLVLVVEDLHWSDPSTLELISRLLENCRDAPVLAILTSRPEFEAPWPASAPVVPIVLERLASERAREMISSTPGGDALPATLVDRIVERADGVPLFVEELTMMVVESGSRSEDDIPATLHESLAARLDRLGSAKDVAQRASVLGREFSGALLSAVSDDREADRLAEELSRLVDAELLYRRGDPPHTTYVFKHALVLDAAYQSLLRRQRQRLHLRVARVLEERFPARAAGDPAFLAHHLDRAGDAPRAIEAYALAARAAGERSANAEAEHQLLRAAELTGQLDAGPDRDARELALRNLLGIVSMRMRGYANDASLQEFERAEHLARAARDDEALAVTLVGLSAYHQNRSEHAAAIAHAEEIVALAERTHAPLHRLTGHGLISPPTFYVGDFERSLSESRLALQHYRDSGAGPFTSVNDFGVASHGFAAWAATLLGRLDEGLQAAADAVALAEEVDHAFSTAFAYVFRAGTHLFRREPELALQWASRAVALAEELHFPLWRGVGAAIRAWAELETGGGDAALADLQAGLAVAGATGSQAGAPLLLGMLAEGHLRTGNPVEATSVLDAALALSANTGQPFADSRLLRLRGGAVRAAGGPVSEAETLYLRAIEAATRVGARLFELRAALCLSELRREQGAADPNVELAAAYAGFDAGQDAPDLIEARALLRE